MENMVAARIDPDSFTLHKVIYSDDSAGVAILIPLEGPRVKFANFCFCKAVIHEVDAIFIQNLYHVIPLCVLRLDVGPAVLQKLIIVEIDFSQKSNHIFLKRFRTTRSYSVSCEKHNCIDNPEESNNHPE